MRTLVNARLVSLVIVSLIAATGSIVFILSGCSSDSKRVQQDTIERGIISGIAILTIDNCEYVWMKRGYSGGLSHKGNCKFCVERKQKVLK